MNCKKIRLKLERYVSWELNVKEYALVTEHLKNCEYCSMEFQDIRRIFQLAELCERKPAEEELLENLFQKILSQVEETKKQNEQFGIFLKFDLVPAALLLSSVLLFAAAFNMMGFVKLIPFQEYLVKNISVFEVLYVYDDKSFKSMIDLNENRSVKQ